MIPQSLFWAKGGKVPYNEWTDADKKNKISWYDIYIGNIPGYDLTSWLKINKKN